MAPEEASHGSTTARAGAARQSIEEVLLKVAAELVLELRKGRPIRVTLDRRLDDDLGFDSLSRAELLLRVEKALGVALPEELLASADTLRDLLHAALSAQPAGARPELRRPRRAQEEESTGAIEIPEGASTLVEALAFHVAHHPQRTHALLYETADSEPVRLSYADLDQKARTVAAALAASSLAPGQTVALMLPTSVDYLATFFGALLAGLVPVPIYPPARPSQIEDHLRRHGRILDTAQARCLITVPEGKGAARLLKGQAETLEQILTPAELEGDPSTFRSPPIAETATAFVQFTSGSTGQPKGVVLTHADLLANIRAMGEAVRASPEDVFVSWLPLYHDMGLIGAWLGSLYFGMRAVLMTPLSFLARPDRWLWAIHEHRATLSAAPNFAYELCLSRIPDESLAGLDLSSWRRAFNGAEPVSPRTVTRFAERFSPLGLDPRALAPVYGLAEAAVGLAFPPIDSGAVIDRIEREPFERSGRAIPASDEDATALEFVACGRPLPGYEIRIVSEAGHELGEREEGRLEFRGPSATSGYMRNPEATAALFDGDWLDSGDLAYVSGADVYLTGRVKDVIIRAGRNIFPYEVEEAVGDLEGIRKGCVAVFGSTDPQTGTERLVILAETRETDASARDELCERIRVRSQDILGQPPDEIVVVPPRTVLKTSSGKIRRAASRELYEQGATARRPRSVGWQIARLTLSGLGARSRRMRRRLAELTYCWYVRSAFLLLAVPTWLAVVLLPTVGMRWRAMRLTARALFTIARIPFSVRGGEDPASAGSCVYVANHSSYLDGLVAVAALPGAFSFAAKAELERRFVPRLFLRRIGARFVERFDAEQSVADAEREIEAARSGESLFFFAEGTFTREPGLRPFRLGAFQAAVRAGLPVVPVTIRGARSVLRGDTWFPRRGAIAVVVSDPIPPTGADWSAAVRLRDACRAGILEHLGEPDLEAG